MTPLPSLVPLVSREALLARQLEHAEGRTIRPLGWATLLDVLEALGSLNAPTLDQVAREAGCCEHTALKWLRRLRAAGLVHAEHSLTPWASGPGPFIYRLRARF